MKVFTLRGWITIIGLIMVVSLSLWSLIVDVYNYSISRTEENKQAIFDDLKAIGTQGQSDVKSGIMGLKDIEENPDKYEPEIRKSLIGYHRQNIIIGTIMTLLWIWIVASGINLIFGKATTSLPVPLLLRYGLAFFIIGCIGLAFGSGFFEGWYLIIKNLSLLSLR